GQGRPPARARAGFRRPRRARRSVGRRFRWRHYDHARVDRVSRRSARPGRSRPVTDQVWWYTARAGSIVALALMAAGVLWCLALSTKVLRGKPRPNWVLDLHRFLGGLAVVFTGVHVTAIVADSYVHFGLTEILVPFTGDWHPVAVAWGIIGAYF